MQLVEMVLVILSPLIITVFILSWLDLLTFHLLYLITACIVGIGVVIPGLILLYARRYSQKAVFNPIIRKVELHVGRKTTPIKLLRNVRESIKLAEKLNCNVVFYTNHLEDQRLRKMFNQPLLIKKANVLQKTLFYIPFFLITFGRKKDKWFPLLYCEIICKRNDQLSKEGMMKNV